MMLSALSRIHVFLITHIIGDNRVSARLFEVLHVGL